MIIAAITVMMPPLCGLTAGARFKSCVAGFSKTVIHNFVLLSFSSSQ